MKRIVKAIVRPTYVADYMDWSHTVMLKRGHWVDTRYVLLRVHPAEDLFWISAYMWVRLLCLGRKMQHSGASIPRIISTDRCCNHYDHLGPTDVGVIYHYKYKSEEEYRIKSCVWGDALNNRGYMPKCRDMFHRGNYPRVGGDFDDSAWRQLKRHHPKYSIFDRFSNVSLYWEALNVMFVADTMWRLWSWSDHNSSEAVSNHNSDRSS